MSWKTRSETAFRRQAGLLLIALAYTALVAGTAEAQNVPEFPGAPAAEPVRVLTLEEALEIATRYNPEYRQARNQLELDGPSHSAAVGAFLPDVSLSASTQQSFVRRTVAEDIFGNPVPNPQVQTSYTSASAQGLSFGWSLFEGLSRFQDFKRRDAQVEAWSSTAEVRLRQLVATVEQGFFEAQLSRELLQVEEDILRVRNRILDATQRLFALAAKSRVDVLQARFEVEQQERAIEDARSGHRRSLLALRTQLGDPDLVDFEVAETPLDVFDPGTLDAAQLVRQALVQNPRIREQQANLAVSRASANAARGTRWPNVRLSGNIGRSEFGPNQTALFDASPSNQTGGSLVLNISWPIFTGFDTSWQIAQADVDRLNRQEAVNRARLQVEEEVRGRLIDLNNAYKALQIALSSQEVADEALRLAGEEYLLAARTFEGLQDVTRQAAGAARQVVEARFSFAQARIALEQWVGGRLVPLP